MHSLLGRYLNKLGIKRDELKDDEKATFENWNRILAKEELTIDDIKDFCRSQLEIISELGGDPNNTSQKNSNLMLQQNVYSEIVKAIEGKKAERNSVEEHLRTLINA